MSNSNYRYSINIPKSQWNLCLQSRKSVNARGFVKSCLCSLIIAFIIILFLRLLNFEQFDRDLPISHRKAIYEICQSNFFLLIHSTNHWLGTLNLETIARKFKSFETGVFIEPADKLKQ